MASGKGSTFWFLVIVAAVISMIVFKCKGNDSESDPNYIGNWKVQEFVNNFGDKTGRKYIFGQFIGRFSKLGVQNESAYIDFLITNSNNVEVQVYEYSFNDAPRQTLNYLDGTLQDSSGNTHSIYAQTTGRGQVRMKFGAESSNVLHNAFHNGGSFKIRLNGDSNEAYSFDISDFQISGYANAYRQLTGN
jgi:hypothetical protein